MKPVQAWYDNVFARGTVPDLCRWWYKLQSISPLFSYYTNPYKTGLEVKHMHNYACSHHHASEECFQRTGINITTKSLRHHAVGATLDCNLTTLQILSFVIRSVPWVKEVNRLTEYVKCHPQAANTLSPMQGIDE